MGWHAVKINQFKKDIPNVAVPSKDDVLNSLTHSHHTHTHTHTHSLSVLSPYTLLLASSAFVATFHTLEKYKFWQIYFCFIWRVDAWLFLLV